VTSPENSYRICVRVHPRAKQNDVSRDESGQVHVRTTVAPADGKANKAVVKLLAAYLGVAPSRITLLRGQKHRNKQFLVKDAVNGL
jgi:hypothetical protein